MRKKIILRLGALHIVFAHIRAIGHYIDGSGIDNSWEIADLFGSRTVFSVLNCGQGAMNDARDHSHCLVFHLSQSFDTTKPGIDDTGYH